MRQGSRCAVQTGVLPGCIERLHPLQNVGAPVWRPRPTVHFAIVQRPFLRQGPVHVKHHRPQAGTWAARPQSLSVTHWHRAMQLGTCSRGREKNVPCDSQRALVRRARPHTAAAARLLHTASIVLTSRSLI